MPSGREVTCLPLIGNRPQIKCVITVVIIRNLPIQSQVVVCHSACVL